MSAYLQKIMNKTYFDDTLCLEPYNSRIYLKKHRSDQSNKVRSLEKCQSKYLYLFLRSHNINVNIIITRSVC